VEKEVRGGYREEEQVMMGLEYWETTEPNQERDLEDSKNLGDAKLI
jgi:hypothetical protein